jgi:hypothetical protein
MKADTGADRTLATKSMFPVHDDAGDRNKGISRLDHERPSSAEQGMKNNEKDEREDSRFKLIAAIEQWICLVLGIACMVSGTLGISMNPGQNDLPAHLAWTGFGYVPLLRITAAACLALGVVLVRLGWTSR